MILTADRPPELQHCGAPQTINQTNLFGSHVRWFADIGTPHSDTHPRWLRSIAALALNYAEGAIAGPVHINVPMREPLWIPEMIDASEPVTPLQIVRGQPRLTSPSLSDLGRRLAAEPRGIIVAGGMIPQASMGQALGTLAARLGWPILPKPTSQLRTPATPALAAHVISGYDALLRDLEFAESHAPRLVLRLGQASTSKIMGEWLARHATDNDLIYPEGRLLDPHHSANMLLVADPELLIADLLLILPQATQGTWLTSWQAAERAARAALDAACAATFWEGGGRP